MTSLRLLANIHGVDVHVGNDDPRNNQWLWIYVQKKWIRWSYPRKYFDHAEGVSKSLLVGIRDYLLKKDKKK